MERKPFTLESYNSGLREAYTEDGTKVFPEFNSDNRVNRNPIIYLNPKTSKYTWITASGKHLLDGNKSLFDIYEEPLNKKYLIALPSFKGAKGFCHRTVLVSAENEMEAEIKARVLKPKDNIGEIKEVNY